MEKKREGNKNYTLEIMRKRLFISECAPKISSHFNNEKDLEFGILTRTDGRKVCFKFLDGTCIQWNTSEDFFNRKGDIDKEKELDKLIKIEYLQDWNKIYLLESLRILEFFTEQDSAEADEIQVDVAEIF